MTTQFADFLAAHAGRIAELWQRQAGGEHGSRQFMSAVLIALTADDLRPLTTLYTLDMTPGIEDRLGRAMHDLQLLARATDAAATEQSLDTGSARALALAANDELGVLSRRLASGCVGLLASQLSSATATSSASSSSLSITMHELRRPLTILSSYVQLLSSGMLGAVPESASVAIEGITASTEMMVRMVGAIAELARLEDPETRLQTEEVEAADLLDAAREQVTMEARLRGITIAAAAPAGVRMHADRRRLVLALTNLLGNAVKHGPPDSNVEAAASVVDGAVHFTVRDHGAGFPAEDAPHLFEKYFRSVAERRRKVPGSGLGLYIVRTVAERHGGSASARTVEGNGAEFEMIIPIRDKE